MKKSAIVLICFWGIWVLATAGRCHGQDNLTRLGQSRPEIKSISSAFTQIKKLSMFDSDQVSTGFFYFKAPDCLRWEYSSPYEQGFAMCAAQGIEWNEISGLKQIDRTNPLWTTIADQLPAWSGLDMHKLRNTYNIFVEQENPLVLKLSPKSRQHIFEKIILTFTCKENILRQIVFFDPNQDQTRIVFNSTRVNEALPPHIFSKK